VLPKFEQFIKERQYVTNVSPSTIEWYKQSLAWLGVESPTEADVKAVVVRMRDSGLKATTCNCRLRAIKAYVRWAGLDIPVPKLKEPQLELPTFDAKDITRLLKWRPKAIAGSSFGPDNILTIGPSIAAFARHPVSYGLPNDYWLQLAERLRRQIERIPAISATERALRSPARPKL